MEATLPHSSLNETQILLLQVFANTKDEREREEIRDLLLNYYQKKVDTQANQFHFSNEKIEEILNSHCRTPYK